MSMRLQEIHPALVHYPLALLPAALTADALGRVTGSEGLLDLGRRLMPVAAASALAAGIFGLVAQESVRTDGTTSEMLATHRTLNLGLIGLAAVMAAKRWGESRPSLRYLALGAGGLAVMSYSAYLGGNMVYEHGVGVSSAGGLLESEAPEITTHNLGEVADVTADHIRTGIQHTLSSADLTAPEARQPVHA
jgi:uncharacterized membrane protein